MQIDRFTEPAGCLRFAFNRLLRLRSSLAQMAKLENFNEKENFVRKAKVKEIKFNVHIDHLRLAMSMNC